MKKFIRKAIKYKKQIKMIKNNKIDRKMIKMNKI